MLLIDSTFSDYFNKVIHCFLTTLYFEEPYGEDRTESAKDFFPDHLWREHPEKCLRVMDDLYYWTQDIYIHELDNIHQLGLYNFLQFAESYEEDIGNEEFSRIFYSGDEYSQLIDSIWKSKNIAQMFDETISKQRLVEYLQDMSTIIDSCFEDIDFITFPEMLARRRDLESPEDFYALEALLADYEDLLPQDIVERHRQDLENAITERMSLFGVVSELLDTVSHMTKYDTLGEVLNSCSEKHAQHILKPIFESLLSSRTDIHISYEPSLAKATPDFVFQLNDEVIIVEIKLANNNIKRGITGQLTHYMKAMKTNRSFILIICQSDKQLKLMKNTLMKVPYSSGFDIKPVILDASIKLAASKLKSDET